MHRSTTWMQNSSATFAALFLWKFPPFPHPFTASQKSAQRQVINQILQEIWTLALQKQWQEQHSLHSLEPHFLALQSSGQSGWGPRRARISLMRGSCRSCEGNRLLSFPTDQTASSSSWIHSSSCSMTSQISKPVHCSFWGNELAC